MDCWSVGSVTTRLRPGSLYDPVTTRLALRPGSLYMFPNAGRVASNPNQDLAIMLRDEARALHRIMLREPEEDSSTAENL